MKTDTYLTYRCYNFLLWLNYYRYHKHIYKRRNIFFIVTIYLSFVFSHNILDKYIIT